LGHAERLSRTIVTPPSGLSVLSTLPAGTPNVASLKYCGMVASVTFPAAVVSLEYICS
jgi:hypothetical protein